MELGAVYSQARLLRKLEDDVERKAHLAVHHRQEVVMLNEAIVEGKSIFGHHLYPPRVNLRYAVGAEERAFDSSASYGYEGVA